MTINMNRALLIGRVGGEPQVHITSYGKPIVRFPLVTYENWLDRETGKRIDRYEWHRIVVKNESLASFAQRAVTKGQHVFVEGANETRSYTTNGVSRTITEVVLGRHKATLDIMRPGIEGAVPDQSPMEEVPWA